jgi:chromosome segregation ATPase
MSDRPTPRTDALKAEYLKSTPVPWTALMTCGTLERELAEAYEEHGELHKVATDLNARLRVVARELAEAREEGEEQARLLGMSGEREAGLLAEIDRLKRELAEAREEIDEWFAVFQFASKCAGDMRKQRDRLATVLRDIKNRALDETVRLHPDADAKGCVDDCLEWAESALTELKGGTDA